MPYATTYTRPATITPATADLRRSASGEASSVGSSGRRNRVVYPASPYGTTYGTTPYGYTTTGYTTYTTPAPISTAPSPY